MWRLSNQDVSAGAQDALSAPVHGRVGPLKRTERNFTDPSGCVLIMIGWLFIALTFLIPYAIGNPDSNKLTYGTDYNGKTLF